MPGTRRSSADRYTESRMVLAPDSDSYYLNPVISTT
jgi:hypothetical protein